jgi:hypothetical protein
MTLDDRQARYGSNDGRIAEIEKSDYLSNVGFKQSAPRVIVTSRQVKWPRGPHATPRFTQHAPGPLPTCGIMYQAAKVGPWVCPGDNAQRRAWPEPLQGLLGITLLLPDLSATDMRPAAELDAIYNSPDSAKL